MISNDKISTIIDDCKVVGYQVRVRDISFVILSKHFEDASVAYKAVFGSDANEGTIESYIESNGLVGGKKKGKKKFNEEDDITFDENKAEIIKLIKETQKALEEGKIKSADALKIQADLRVKLNDKFSVTDNNKDNLVQVLVKYNSICQCGREIYVPTKEELMEKYNLTEKKKE